MTMTEANKAAAKPTVIAQTRKILPKPKSDPLERKMQDSKLLAAESTIRPKSWPNKLEVVILFVLNNYFINKTIY